MRKRSLAFVVGCAIALWLAVPAWAQRGRPVGGGAAMSARSMSGLGASMRHSGMSIKTHSSTSARAMPKMRSNKGGTSKGTDRTDAVQKMNTRADTNRGFTRAPGLATARTHTNASAKTGAAASGSGQTGLNQAQAVQTSNTTADTNRGFSTAPGLATAATHANASANAGAAAKASAQTKGSGKH